MSEIKLNGFWCSRQVAERRSFLLNQLEKCLIRPAKSKGESEAELANQEKDNKRRENKTKLVKFRFKFKN